jgi:3-phosphoshikimate 1-carboxyvinyltransferase
MSASASIDYHVKPGGTLRGRLRVPGDKSVSHRALMLGAIACGDTRISGFLQGEDTLATMAALRAMGVPIEHQAEEVLVHGVGLHGLSRPAIPLNMGNSGTSTRLLAGLLAGQPFDCELTGDASLMQRPMFRIVEPLQEMQADIHCTGEGTLPIHIHGGRRLKAIDYALPVASAQLKSCLLLAGLYAEGTTCVREPAATRDHTERMLLHLGGALTRKDSTVCIAGGGELRAADITVPADISSAAFFMAGACMSPGSDIMLTGVGVNPTRTGIIHILRAMGADITLTDERNVSGEPVADIHVRYAQLHGIEIPEELVPLAIDEFPAIMVIAATARGRTVLRGARELRVKESDRIMAIAAGLEAIGIQCTVQDDGMEVNGGRMTGGMVDSFTDHRIAMAFAMAGLASTRPLSILDCANVNTSFPGFIELAHEAGLHIERRDSGGV